MEVIDLKVSTCCNKLFKKTCKSSLIYFNWFWAIKSPFFILLCNFSKKGQGNLCFITEGKKKVLKKVQKQFDYDKYLPPSLQFVVTKNK